MYIKELAKISGVSPRTLRYYDQIGLLKPSEINQSGYRVYTEQEMKRLQEILIYKTLGVDLKTIHRLLAQSPDHLEAVLKDQKERLEQDIIYKTRLLETVKSMQKYSEKNSELPNANKFDLFKLIAKNKTLYQEELAANYQSDSLETSWDKLIDLTNTQADAMTKIESSLLRELDTLIKNNLSIKSTEALVIYTLHKKWLAFSIDKLTPDLHRSLADLYVADQRFADYYNRLNSQTARTLKSIIYAFTEKD